MFKLIAVSAVLGLAAAQQADRAAIQLRDSLRSTQTESDNLGAQISASGRAAKLFGAGVQNTEAWMDKELASTKDALSKELQAAVNDLTKKIADQKKGIDDAIVKRLSTVVVNSGKVKDDGDAMREQMTEASKCQAEGQLFTGKKCIDPEMPDGAHYAKVYHRMWTNSDGRENGYISNRELSFTKNYDDTYIRVFWYDNIRTHGHTGNGRWNIHICDGGGGSCSHCNDPGKLQNWRHSSHQHNWWMNDHTGGTIFGLCKKTDSFDMKAGDYQLKIYVDNAHYDMDTGSNQHG